MNFCLSLLHVWQYIANSGVYIAIWATNLTEMAVDSYFPVQWEMALVIPICFNFLVMKQVIFTSCMLKSILSMDKHVAGALMGCFVLYLVVCLCSDCCLRHSFPWLNHVNNVN